VKSILGGLAFIQAAASGLLAFLPLHLILNPRTVTTPSGAPVTVYISSIVYRGSIEQLRRNALGMAKEKAQYLIEMDKVEDSARELMDQAVESVQEQKDVQAEFYPDAVEIEPESEPEKPGKTKKKAAAKKKPAAKKKAKPKAKPEKKEPEAEPKPEPAPQPQSDDDSPPEMIVKDQKKQIVLLKKKNKITNPETWQKLLEPFEVKTANNLTKIQADEFIEVLTKNPF